MKDSSTAKTLPTLPFQRQSKFACSNDLFKINFTMTFEVPGLRPKEQFLVNFIATVIRLFGVSGIRLSLAELCAHCKRFGAPMGKSTLRATIKILEDKNYLWRQPSRLGHDRRGSILQWDVSRFSIWVKTQSKRVIPLPQSTTGVFIRPISNTYLPDRQNLAGSNWIKNNTRVNSCNTSINSSYARAGNTDRFNLLHRHPVLLTLWMLLRGSPDIWLYNRAETEVRALESGILVENPCGEPWEQDEKNWRDMSIQTRDSFAASQIIPRLRGDMTPEPIREKIHPETISGYDHFFSHPDPTPEEILELRRYREKGLPGCH